MIYFFLLISFTSLARGAKFSPDIQNLVTHLENDPHIASISVDGFTQGLDRLPTCTVCHTVQEAKFKDNVAIRSWYGRYAACRCQEHHELARVAAWCAAPIAAGCTMHTLCRSYAPQHNFLATLRLPFMVSAAYIATKFSSWVVRPLSRFVQRRADYTAFVACKNRQEQEAVIAHLERMRTKYLQEGGILPDAQDWQLMTINAYDETQENRASILHVHVQLPMEDLVVEDLAQNLAERIAYLKGML